MMKWGPLWKFVLVVVLVGVALSALDRYTSFDLLGASEPPPPVTPDWGALAEATVWERTAPKKTEATPTPSPKHTPTPVPQSPVASYRLEVTVRPEALGSVQVSPSGDNGLYAAGATVVVTAACTIALVGWTGDLPDGQSASANILTLTMDRDRTLIAGCAEPTPSPTATPLPSASPVPELTPTATSTPVPAWVALADAPTGVEGGAALASDGTDIFALEGGGENGFWTFDPDEESWHALTKVPRAVNDGGSLLFAGGYIYALRGGTSKDFWRYDVADGAWKTRASTPASVGWGGSLAWDGSDTIYALRGARRDDFWMYSLSGGTWTPLARSPQSVYEGGALTFVAGDIYALRGDGTVEFWRYDLGTHTLSTAADAPAPVVKGRALSSCADGFIYALRGGVTTEALCSA